MPAAEQDHSSTFHVEPIGVHQLSEMAAPYNPRQITDHDFEALRRSLTEFGAVEPVVCNRRTNRIVGGHQRVKAALAEGFETLPVWWVDLSEEQERTLNLALNRVHGDWDDEKLRAMLSYLEQSGSDLRLTGFDDTELKAHLALVDYTPDEHGSRAGFDRKNPVTCPGCGLEFEPT